jgi:hypothetical protein
MKNFFLLVVLLCLSAFIAAPGQAQCYNSTAYGNCTTATCTAADTTEASFVAAWPSNSNANATVTVNIPSGTSTWTTVPNCTQPASVTNLIIHGNTVVTCTGTAGTSGYGCTAADNTIIADGNTANTYIFQFNLGALATTFRFTGLTIKGTATGVQKYDGGIALYGNSGNVRMDHFHLNAAGYPIGTVSYGWVRANGQGTLAGVVDHFVVDQNPNYNTAPGTDWNFFQAGNAYNDTIGNADGTWNNATPWGTSHGWYVEAGQINGAFGNDCFNGGFMVMRYNYFNGMNEPLQTHATKSDAGSPRGCRGVEFYHNYATNTLLTNAVIGGKGGPYLGWSNTAAAGSFRYLWDLSTDRATTAQGEVGPPQGWGYVGSTPAFTGTVSISAPSGGTYTITGSGFSTSWPASGKFNVACNGGGGGLGGWCTFLVSSVGSSSSMTATCTQPPNAAACPGGSLSSVAMNMGSNWDGNMGSAGSDGYPGLDALGRGQTTQALNGANLPGRLNSVTGTIAWPHQYLEPIYSWMNSVTGTVAQLLLSDNITTQNTDIFLENGSCGGSGCSGLTTGTGYGTLAQIPTSCTPGPGGTYYTSPTGSYGVAYWATDANSGNGELYVCTSANTWTAVYQPYIYPHPLDTNGTVTLSPASQSFGSIVLTNSGSPITFTLTNGSGVTATSVSPTVTGGNAGDFTVTNSGAGSCNAAGGSIAASASCTFTVTFTPSALGVRASTVSVSYSGGDGASPQTAPVSGTGASQVGLSVNALSFGNVVDGTTSPQLTVTLTNNGSSSLTGLTLSLTGTNASLFTIATPVGTNCNTTSTIAAAGTCVAAVTFSPTTVANGLVATLNFTDSATGSPQTVSLTGNGIAPVTQTSGDAFPPGWPW